MVEEKTWLDAGGLLAFPVGSDHEIGARIVSRSAAANIAKVVGIAVDQLHRIIALLLHRRHGDHHRLGTQIQPQYGVWRVAVRRDDRCVFIGRHMVEVVDLVERRLELAGLRVDGELVHDRIIHHERQAVDEAFLGDVLGLDDAGIALRHQEAWPCNRGARGDRRGGAKQISFRQHLPYPFVIR